MKGMRKLMESAVPAGHVRVEIISGPEGPCLSFARDNTGGKRVAGPKPWGGGSVTHAWDVPAEEFAAALRSMRTEEEA